MLFRSKYLNHAFGRDFDSSIVTKTLDKIEKDFPKTGPIRDISKEVYRALAQITTTSLLGLGKASTALQGVIQPVLMSFSRIPQLEAELGLSHRPDLMLANIGVSSLDGVHSLMNALTFGRFSKVSLPHLDPFTRAIHNYIDKNGISQMSLIDKSRLFGEGGMLKESANYLLGELPGRTVSIFETFTRPIFFSSIARYMRMRGYSVEDSLRFAHESMDRMVNYDPHGRAAIFEKMGEAGKLAGGLHQFMFNSYSQAALHVKQASMHKAATAYYFAGIVATAGFIGLPMFDLLDNLSGMLARRFNPASRFSLRGAIMETMPDKLEEMYGDTGRFWGETLAVGPLSTMTGQGAYGYFSSKIYDPNRSIPENVGLVPYAVADKVTSFAKLPFATTDVDKGTALEKISPAVMREGWRERYKTENGYQLDAAGNKIPYLRTEAEKKSLSLKFGMPSLAETMTKEQYYRLREQNKNISEAKRNDLNKLKNYYIDSFLRAKSNPESAKKGEELFNTIIDRYGMQPDKINQFLDKVQQDFVYGGDLAIQSFKAMEQEDFDKAMATMKLQERSQSLQKRYAGAK